MSTDLNPPRTDAKWYQQHGCTHAHCPRGCDQGDKAQPFLDRTGRLWCGRCVALQGRLTEMVPCTPLNCVD